MCEGVYTSQAAVGVRREIGKILLHICPGAATHVSSATCAPDKIIVSDRFF